MVGMMRVGVTVVGMVVITVFFLFYNTLATQDLRTTNDQNQSE